MTPILSGLIIGSVIGFGLLLVWRGIHPPKPAAVDVIRAAGQRHTPGPSSWWDQTIELAARTGDIMTKMASDLGWRAVVASPSNAQSRPRATSWHGGG